MSVTFTSCSHHIPAAAAADIGGQRLPPTVSVIAQQPGSSQLINYSSHTATEQTETTEGAAAQTCVVRLITKFNHFNQFLVMQCLCTVKCPNSRSVQKHGCPNYFHQKQSSFLASGPVERSEVSMTLTFDHKNLTSSFFSLSELCPRCEGIPLRPSREQIMTLGWTDTL